MEPRKNHCGMFDRSRFQMEKFRFERDIFQVRRFKFYENKY